jgi:MOSC domain-containing protein YiiM
MSNHDLPTAGRLASVNVVHALVDNPVGPVPRTGIDKRPVTGRVKLEYEGPVGDVVMERSCHGGPDKAVMAYALEDLQRWQQELGREISPGLFGENFTTEGVDVTRAVIGERWKVGRAEVQVRMARLPCATFQAWMEEPHWVRRFTEFGAPGAYLKVTTEGWVEAGDAIDVIHRPEHGVTVYDTFIGRRGDPERLLRLLATDDVAPDLAEGLRREVAVATDGTSRVMSAEVGETR